MIANDEKSIKWQKWHEQVTICHRDWVQPSEYMFHLLPNKSRTQMCPTKCVCRGIHDIVSFRYQSAKVVMTPHIDN